MKKLDTYAVVLTFIITIIIAGCAHKPKSEWDVIPEYVDYRIDTNSIVALTNALERELIK